MRRKKHIKLPNGYGSIKHLSGKRRNPYAVYPPVTEWDMDGRAQPVKALCYVDSWYKGFTVLTWLHNGEWEPGRELELYNLDEQKVNDDLVAQVLRRYALSERQRADSRTFRDVYEDFFMWKFKKPYSGRGTTSSERAYVAGFKNSAEIHDKPFANLRTQELQNVLDHQSTRLKHSSLELIKLTFNAVYSYALSMDMIDKNYGSFCKIPIPDDDVHGIPFSDAELETLWAHSMDPVAEIALILTYSGWRIGELKTLTVDLTEDCMRGGSKTKAGKNRVVPIHPTIRPLVQHRLADGELLPWTPSTYGQKLRALCNELGLSDHTPHDARHTFNALCDRYGVNERDKKLMLGHSFQDVTNSVYMHRTLEELRAELVKICY